MVGGGGWEAPGGHRGQFLRTDFGSFRKSTPVKIPQGALKLHLLGGFYTSRIFSISLVNNISITLRCSYIYEPTKYVHLYSLSTFIYCVHTIYMLVIY